jgi:hypothetical protein
MIVTICGSRSLSKYSLIEESIKESKFDITEINCGMAIGIDMLGYDYAIKNNIKVNKFYPKWDLWGISAGFIRNIEMVDKSDAVIAIWDGKSKGTKHTIDYTKKVGKFIYIKEMK